MSNELTEFPSNRSERVYNALDDFAKEQLEALLITPGHPDFQIMNSRKKQRRNTPFKTLTESVKRIKDRLEKWPNKYPLGPSEFAELELYREKRARSRSAEGPGA